jgi:hypothetical protein
MSEHARHTPEEIAFAAEGIRLCPGGVDPDALIEGALFLGAIALDLERCVPSAAEKVAANQDRIAYFRGRGMRFAELSALTANVVLGSLWLDEFFDGVCPKESDPKAIFMDSIAALEELSSGRQVPAAFAVHAFLETPPPERQSLLTALAAQR